MGEEQLGKLEDEEKEPEHTDLGLDLDKREEQIACNTPALALAMTDEARRETEM